MAAVASAFTKGSKEKAAGPLEPPAAAAAGATASLPSSINNSTAAVAAADSSPSKPSRWRALFGSPSQRRPPSPRHHSMPADRGDNNSRRCSVLDSTGVHSGGSCMGDGAASSCSSSPAGYIRSPASVAAAEGVAAITTTTTTIIGHLGVCSSTGVLDAVARPLSPCKKGLSAVASTGQICVDSAPAASGVSGELGTHNSKQQPPVTPGSAAAHAASVAAAEAARASGSCSPLKAHARKLSLPSKLMVLGSTDSSPASSPNPVAPAGDASAAASGRCVSPSKLGAGGAGSISSNSRGNSGDGAAASGAEAGPGSSSSSHSQLLAEALQLEVMARNLSQSGRHGEAEVALRNSLAMISKQLGPGHPNTIAATTRLALHLNRHAKHTEAEQLLRQVLTHKQAMLGRKHPQVAAASINLAACLYSQGNYNAAARLYSTALEVRKAALGETHADTAACINNLALCHSRCVAVKEGGSEGGSGG